MRGLTVSSDAGDIGVVKKQRQQQPALPAGCSLSPGAPAEGALEEEEEEEEEAGAGVGWVFTAGAALRCLRSSLNIWSSKYHVFVLLQEALCNTHLPQSPTAPQPSALSELMMGTSGCEPRTGACDCRRKTAYRGTLTAKREITTDEVC
ncbi:unnamed protein product [Pleuronectes platessa]|uniref:Uncharacterized protein n=1 Tax=Pleuronectes platessa TaxID=8262 RepID=A0A9N7TPQ6_PLEPL|nr:unnamed protein product [Pleuronectes platessa]